MAERSPVGLMIPSSNTAMEPDFQDGLAGMVTVHTARMFLAEATPEGESRMLVDAGGHPEQTTSRAPSPAEQRAGTAGGSQDR